MEKLLQEWIRSVHSCSSTMAPSSSGVGMSTLTKTFWQLPVSSPILDKIWEAWSSLHQSGVPRADEKKQKPPLVPVTRQSPPRLLAGAKPDERLSRWVQTILSPVWPRSKKDSSDRSSVWVVFKSSHTLHHLAHLVLVYLRHARLVDLPRWTIDSQSARDMWVYANQRVSGFLEQLRSNRVSLQLRNAALTALVADILQQGVFADKMWRVEVAVELCLWIKHRVPFATNKGTPMFENKAKEWRPLNPVERSEIQRLGDIPDWGFRWWDYKVCQIARQPSYELREEEAKNEQTEYAIYFRTEVLAPDLTEFIKEECDMLEKRARFLLTQVSREHPTLISQELVLQLGDFPARLMWLFWMRQEAKMLKCDTLPARLSTEWDSAVRVAANWTPYWSCMNPGFKPQTRLEWRSDLLDLLLHALSLFSSAELSTEKMLGMEKLKTLRVPAGWITRETQPERHKRRLDCKLTAHTPKLPFLTVPPAT